jgi:hypothetical protein
MTKTRIKTVLGAVLAISLLGAALAAPATKSSGSGTRVTTQGIGIWTEF